MHPCTYPLTDAALIMGCICAAPPMPTMCKPTSIPDAGGFRGPFYLVAAGDWFGSQHLSPHSPREAPHVCTV